MEAGYLPRAPSFYPRVTESKLLYRVTAGFHVECSAFLRDPSGWSSIARGCWPRPSLEVAMLCRVEHSCAWSGPGYAILRNHEPFGKMGVVVVSIV
jgi:hypothetical protein